MKTKLTNKILIPVLALIILLFLVCLFLFKPSNGGYADSVVHIKQGNKTVEKISIKHMEGEWYEHAIGTNTIRITQDGVYMKDASCPDKLCVHSGVINKPGQSIVCLPNKIMVEIEGSNTKVDAVAGAR